jgi:hypothetical protein
VASPKCVLNACIYKKLCARGLREIIPQKSTLLSCEFSGALDPEWCYLITTSRFDDSLCLRNFYVFLGSESASRGDQQRCSDYNYDGSSSNLIPRINIEN